MPAPRNFLLKVVLPYEGDECLIWPFYLNPQGYPKIGYDGKVHYGNRLVCTLAHGEPPAPNLDACHSCRGNRACVNKRHLRWGTRAENMADARADGTMVLGEKHYAARLTTSDVVAILETLDVRPRGIIAARYSVSERTISDIHLGRTWTHVRPDMPRSRPDPHYVRRGKPIDMPSHLRSK